MQPDLTQPGVARSLRGLPQEMPAPYDWAGFQRRRRAAAQRRLRAARYRLAAGLAATAVLVSAAVLLRSSNMMSARTDGGLSASRHAPGPLSEGAVSAASSAAAIIAAGAPGSRAEVMAGWLADLPPQPAVVRVGTKAAVGGLEDQIAELDDLMSAARVAGTRTVALAGLERERTELVSSLAQLRYAEMLADEASGRGATSEP